MQRLVTKLVPVAALCALALASQSARADIGPIEPARSACMGQAEGAPCELDGRKGTCHGPHPSRMYCELPDPKAPKPAPAPTEPTEKPPAPPATEPAPTATATEPAPTATEPAPAPTATEPAPAPPATEPAPPTTPATEPSAPAPKPAHKGSCATSQPSGAALVLLALLGALAVRRRASRTQPVPRTWR